MLVISGTGTGNDGKILAAWNYHPSGSSYQRDPCGSGAARAHNDISAWDAEQST